MTDTRSKPTRRYETAYKSLMDWRKDKEINSFAESVLLDYFEEISDEKYKSTTLWNQYSMLKSILKIRHDVNLDHYKELRAFLKRKAEGYEPKRSQTFTLEHINKFIKNAADEKYLATKVMLIMGYVGACCGSELKQMHFKDVQDLKSSMLVTVRAPKNKIIRTFLINGEFYEVVKKYIALRPTDATCSYFFLQYQNGCCSNMKLGIGKFSSGREVAEFLELPNPDLFSGHSIRKSGIDTDAKGMTEIKTITLDITTSSLTLENCSNFTLNVLNPKQGQVKC